MPPDPDRTQMYQRWIDEYVPTYKEALGNCVGLTEAMAICFPELTRVRGNYYCASWGERTHWWLVDAEGNIVDPTAKQFPSEGRGAYVPWQEGEKEPTGKCPNCGEYAYDNQYFCSDECGHAYAAFCQASIR